ncbi:hypothetical protein [Cohnella thailandensis]|uniref:Uncharacterized protein n=1 Tax=Cohnella thailandensis TaxID=557557 RepID=A0A841T2L0_9BACL|nr:hypothetical protein [Cohnella thailandensis]MBB6637259.1 hypothetical protein [Cohnella thailandensis]MBP1976934.1 anion-transporting ArsA/GET3 family ATPase [Cohnella thailandensis]
MARFKERRLNGLVASSERLQAISKEIEELEKRHSLSAFAIMAIEESRTKELKEDFEQSLSKQESNIRRLINIGIVG